MYCPDYNKRRESGRHVNSGDNEALYPCGAHHYLIKLSVEIAVLKGAF